MKAAQKCKHTIRKAAPLFLMKRICLRKAVSRQKNHKEIQVFFCNGLMCLKTVKENYIF